MSSAGFSILRYLLLSRNGLGFPQSVTDCFIDQITVVNRAFALVSSSPFTTLDCAEQCDAEAVSSTINLVYYLSVEHPHQSKWWKTQVSGWVQGHAPRIEQISLSIVNSEKNQVKDKNAVLPPVYRSRVSDAAACLFVSPFACLLVCLSVCMYVCVSVSRSVCLSISLFVPLSFSLSVALCLSISGQQGVCIFV